MGDAVGFPHAGTGEVGPVVLEVGELAYAVAEEDGDEVYDSVGFLATPGRLASLSRGTRASSPRLDWGESERRPAARLPGVAAGQRRETLGRRSLLGSAEVPSAPVVSVACVRAAAHVRQAAFGGRRAHARARCVAERAVR